MTRSVLIAAIATAFVLFASPGRGDDLGRVSCVYHGDPDTCSPYGCLSASTETNPDLIDPNDKAGFCGSCRTDSDCGGAKCNLDKGTCSLWNRPPPPPTVWPHFGLLVGDTSLAFAASKDVQPIVGVGYVFQGAFSRVAPVKKVDGFYLAENLPRLYWNVGLTAAFAGEGQNVFGEAGLTHYHPGWPLLMTTSSLGVLYEREGSAIWKVTNETENEDRLGPDITLGFLQNVFVRVAYMLPLRGSDDSRQTVVSILYMRDLASDLIPDQFHAYLPDAFR
jgi:hypothetical protein